MNSSFHKIFTASSILILLFSFIPSASAHVVVKPAEITSSSFVSFTVGVPVEKDMPTTSLRLVIPNGLKHVTPNVKPGWKVEIKKLGNDTEAQVAELIWPGGSIPVGFREEFNFSAQAPSSGEIFWKAYQTYSDNSVVAWELSPSDANKIDSENSGPYSITRIVEPSTINIPDDERNLTSPRNISLLALGLALLSVAMHLTHKKHAQNS